jgi:hypothetical protein
MLSIISVKSARNELTMIFDAAFAATSSPVAIPANGIVARRTISNLKVTEICLIWRSTSYKEHNSQDINPPTTTKIMPTEMVSIDQRMIAEAERTLYIITNEISKLVLSNCFQIR